jgi:aminopeptidase N
MNAAYRRGALFLADLRNTMGDQQFYAFLQDYCQSQSHKLSTADDFFSVLSRHTDEDLSALLGEYFAQEEGEGES